MSARLSTLLGYAATGLFSLSLFLLPNADASAKNTSWLKGPIPGHVDRVIDGDTVVVRANIWLDQVLKVRVRLAGIDAPEMRSRNPDERKSAQTARNALLQLAHGHRITLRNIRRGKYAGRVIAELYLSDGTNVSKRLLNAGIVRPYRKKIRIKRYCRSKSCTSIKIDVIRIDIAP